MKSKAGLLTLLVTLSLGAFSANVMAEQTPKTATQQQVKVVKKADQKAVAAAEKAAKKAAAKAQKQAAKEAKKAAKAAKKAAKLAAKEQKRIAKENAKGPKVVEPVVSHKVPEIDAAGAPLALALMAGCMALVRERKRRLIVAKS